VRRSILLAGLTLVLVAGSGAVPQAVASDVPLQYVALGDSYSAASGVLPVDATSPQCLRSTANYPNVIAASIGAELTDVTCGGAETKDFFEGQHPGVAPQMDALSASTDLVTMTIGGNDSGVFIGAILACGAASLTTAGTGSPCKDQNGSSFEDTVRNVTYPDLVKALDAVHDRAPNAHVLILGYPWILPKSKGCFPILPVAEGDVPYLRSLQATLNDAVKRAAAATGSTYVDFTVASEGHDACAPLGTRWIEPVVLTTNPIVVHPNALGEAEMARHAIAAMGRRDTRTSVKLPGKKLPLGKKRRLKGIRVACPATEVSGPCAGTVTVLTERVPFKGRKQRVRLARVSYAIPAGTSRTFSVRVARKKVRLLRTTKAARNVVTIARTRDAAGNTATVSARQRVKLP
jgi:lysophospholipase L1-like esterase